MFRRKSRTKSAPQIGSSVCVTVNANKSTTVRSTRKLSRSQSAPVKRSARRMKGIMKFATADDSLHSVYGQKTESDSGSSSLSEEKTTDRQIKFKCIEIREYARTLGDNPSCSSGPPISISWEYNPETEVFTIDQYESLRPPRRTHFQMILPRDVRQHMLRNEWDVTQAQIAAAVRANVKAKNQRRMTINNLGKATKLEEVMESASRKLWRGLSLQKRISKQVEDLEKQLDEAECARAHFALENHMTFEYSEQSTEEETFLDLATDTSTPAAIKSTCDNSKAAVEAVPDSAPISKVNTASSASSSGGTVTARSVSASLLTETEPISLVGALCGLSRSQSAPAITATEDDIIEGVDNSDSDHAVLAEPADVCVPSSASVGSIPAISISRSQVAATETTIPVEGTAPVTPESEIEATAPPFTEEVDDELEQLQRQLADALNVKKKYQRELELLKQEDLDISKGTEITTLTSDSQRSCKSYNTNLHDVLSNSPTSAADILTEAIYVSSNSDIPVLP